MFSFIRHPFTKNTPTKNNVLLIETNGCHGEVIAGYIKYFQELNFNVYVLVTDTIKKENPFCRLNNFKIFYSKFKNFRKLLKNEYINRYDHIFVMSSVCYTGGTNSVRDLYPDLQKHKSVYYVHHNLDYIKKYYQDTDKKHNIMLGHIIEKNSYTYINPHLFGKYDVPKKSEPTIFISVGGINPKRKNHELLINAIKTLHDKGYQFKVLIVGSGSLNHLDKNIKQHIELLGHLNYPEMYKNVEKANFFLPLLDAHNPDHNRYIKTQITGSAQLIYGFRKIPVIHSKFAKFYDFNSKNAILYENLADGMEQAILTKSSNYDKYIKNLNTTSNNIKQESLNNLKDILDV